MGKRPIFIWIKHKVSTMNDLTNQKFGRLTALKAIEERKNGCIVWFCRCKCGKTCDIRSTHLRNGNTQSCGCLQVDRIVEHNANQDKSRFATHGMSETATYQTWKNMKQRCLNINNKDYKNYGGRGIVVCDRWLKFENFFEDMGEKPKGLTIDRINNNGNYGQNNCWWTTRIDQSANMRRATWFTAKNMKTGKVYMSNSRKEFAAQHGLHATNICACLRGKYRRYHEWTFELVSARDGYTKKETES